MENEQSEKENAQRDQVVEFWRHQLSSGQNDANSQPMQIQKLNLSEFLQNEEQREKKFREMMFPLSKLSLISAHSSPDKTQPVHDIDSEPTLQQRLTHNVSTPVQKIYPKRTPLRSKLALRCPHCHKYVLKPSPAISRVKFEINFAALHVLPSLSLNVDKDQIQRLRGGEVVHIGLGIRNPLEREFSVRVEHFDLVKYRKPETESKDEEKEAKLKHDIDPVYLEWKMKQRRPPPEFEHSFAYQPPVAPMQFINSPIQTFCLPFDDLEEEAAIAQPLRSKLLAERGDTPEVILNRMLNFVEIKLSLQLNEDSRNTRPFTDALFCDLLLTINGIINRSSSKTDDNNQITQYSVPVTLRARLSLP